MALYFEVSDHTRHNILGHHTKVAKNDEGTRGAPADWRGYFPTREGYIDLGFIPRRVASYAMALCKMDQNQDVVGPTIAIVTPKKNVHCRQMGQLIGTGLSRFGGVTVLRRELAELDSIDTPPLLRVPPGALSRQDRIAAEGFAKEFIQWENGIRPAMPDPRAVGDTRSPVDYLQRALEGQRKIAEITAAHLILQLMTTTGGHLANAALSPNIEEALATGIFPATPMDYGTGHIYEQLPGDQPRRITERTVRLKNLTPPQPPLPLDVLLNDAANVPFA